MYLNYPTVKCRDGFLAFQGRERSGGPLLSADRSGTELIKVMTGIRRCGKSVMLELIHPQVAPAPQELQDKHYFRKHGADAYYGQN